MTARAWVSVASLTLCLGGVSSCAAPTPSAWVEVEVLSGAAQPAPLAEASVQRLLVILDLTWSMERPAAIGAPIPLQAAKAATVRLLEGLPEPTEVGVQVLGIASGGQCPPPVWFSTSGGEQTPARLAAGLGALGARSEGSLSEALAQAQEAVQRSDAAASWRLVLFSDLGRECGADPCRGIQALVELGTQVDVVLLGSERPACLAEIEPPDAPTLAQALVPPPAPAFRVEALPDAKESDAVVWARGRAGEGPIAVPSGRAIVVVEVEPPFRIGPVDLRNGVVTTVKGVDFPAAPPSWRAWSVARRAMVGTPGRAP